MMGWFRRKPLPLPLPLLKAPVLGVLREFIYLDDVSIYSLLASRLGPIAHETTETASHGLETEAGGKVSGNVFVTQAESSVRALSTRSRGAEVLRKSNVQASFKELVELEQDRLVLRDKRTVKGGAIALRDISQTRTELAVDRLVIPTEELRRGRLIEVEVQLDVEPIYRMNAVLSSMIGIANSSPELFDAPTRAVFKQGRAVEVALHGLLGGLVPIRARIPDYVVQMVAGQETIVHEQILSGSDRAAAIPIRLVGVAEEALFWKDVRRVLFSGGRYTVLARVGAPGVQQSWNPVKLAHVLESFVPGFGDHMNQMSTMALQQGAKKPGSKTSAHFVGPAVSALLDILRESPGVVVSPEVMSAAEIVVHRYADVPYTLQSVRIACDELVDAVSPSLPDKPNRTEIARLRQRAQESIGGASATESEDDQGTTRSERFLDCELIAIYW